MKGKSVALLLLALGCGLVAALGITQVLAKRGDSTPPVDTSSVYVAKAEITAGTLIGEDNIKVEQWPKDRVPEGAITRPEDYNDRRARQNIFAGEPLIQLKLLPRGQVPIDGLVPKGMRVVPVPVGYEATHDGLVLPGSRCDVQVFIRADAAQGFGETLCKTILQDIKVFAVNDSTTTESSDPKGPEAKSMPGARTVSLLVTPTQAQIVTLASQLGSIRLILRSANDDEVTKNSMPVTSRELLGMNGAGDRAKENPAEAEEERFRKWLDKMKIGLRESAKADPAKPAVEAEHWTIRVRTGSAVNDVMLTNNSGVHGLGEEAAWTATGMGPSAAKSVDTHTSKATDTGAPGLPLGSLLPSATGAIAPALPAGALSPSTTAAGSQPASSALPGSAAGPMIPAGGLPSTNAPRIPAPLGG